MSTNLAWTSMDSDSGDKEGIFNDSFSAIDSGLTSQAIIVWTTGETSTVPLTATWRRSYELRINAAGGGSAPTSAETLTIVVTNISQKPFIVTNNTLGNVVVGVGGFVVAPGEKKSFYYNGTSVIQVSGARDNLLKAPVRIAHGSNVTISTALNNGDALSGVTLATGDRVLLFGQTDPKENGIYVAAVSPSRTDDADETGEILPGTLVYVRAGTNAGKLFFCTNATTPTIGTDNVTWDDVGSGLVGSYLKLDGTTTMTGLLKAADGLVSGPGYTFGSDPDTGMFRSAGALSFAVDSTMKLDLQIADAFFTSPISSASRITTTADGSAASIIQNSYQSTATSSRNLIQHARGSLAAPADLITNDGIFRAEGAGYGGGAFRVAYQVSVTTTEVIPGAAAMGSREVVSIAAIGAATVSEITRTEHATGFSMFGANVIIDQNRVLHPREYTVATAPVTATSGIAQFSDEGGSKALGFYDSVTAAFRRLDDNQVISATNGARGLLARFPTRQDSKYRDLVRATYQKLEDAGLAGASGKLKGLWVHAAPTQAIALLNWITPGTRDLTIIGAPTFTANIGFTGDGSSALLSTAVAVSSFYIQNDAAYGTYVRTASAASAPVVGNRSGDARRMFLESDTSGTLTGIINSSTNTAFTVSKYTGMFTHNRTASTVHELFIDDVSQGVGSNTSSSLGTVGITFLGTADTTAASYSTAQICFSFIANSMTATEIRKLRSIMVDYYLVKMGAITAAVANLPPYQDFLGEDYYIPDLGGGAGEIFATSTEWRRTGETGYEAVSADADTTVHPLANAPDILLTGTLTALRNLTLGHGTGSINRYYAGAKKRIIRTGGGLFDWVIKNNVGTELWRLRQNQIAEFVHDGSAWVLVNTGSKKELEPMIMQSSDMTTAITTGTLKSGMFMPYVFRITDCFIGLLAAQSSSGPVTVNVYLNGTTIFSTQPSMAVSTDTNLSGGTLAALTTNPTICAKGDRILVEIVGAGTGAKGLQVVLLGYQ